MYNSKKIIGIFLVISGYFIEHLRSIWLEDCTNIHFLLSAIDKQHLKVLYFNHNQKFYNYILFQNIVLRRSTCDRTILTNFFDQFDTLHYLDLASLQSHTFSISKKYLILFFFF